LTLGCSRIGLSKEEPSPGVGVVGGVSGGEGVGGGGSVGVGDGVGVGLGAGVGVGLGVGMGAGATQPETAADKIIKHRTAVKIFDCFIIPPSLTEVSKLC